MPLGWLDWSEDEPLAWDSIVRHAIRIVLLAGLTVATLLGTLKDWSVPRGPLTVALLAVAVGGLLAVRLNGRRPARQLAAILLPVAVCCTALGIVAATGVAAVFLFLPIGPAATRWPVPWSVTLVVATSGAYWGGYWIVHHQIAQPWLFTALAASYVAGLLNRAHHTRVAQTRELLAQTERAQSAEARSAVLAERTRIAREMHDVLAHSLAGLAVQLEAADALLSNDRTEQARDVVRRSRRLAREGLAETRQAVLALREGAGAPLPEALGGLLDAFDPVLRTRFRVDGAPRELSQETTFALYRITQEALTNTAKHAAGAPVWVELGYPPGAVTLAVRNDPPPGVPSPDDAAVGVGLAVSGGYGLTGMRERVEPLGGELTVGPVDGGWRVAARIPV